MSAYCKCKKGECKYADDTSSKGTWCEALECFIFQIEDEEDPGCGEDE